jgi:predicted amidophosphoribosyltransferase
MKTFQNEIFEENGVNFLSFLIIKKDREQIGPVRLRGSMTEMILSAKDASKGKASALVRLMKKELANEKLLLIPFPSTNKDKPTSAQLPYQLVKGLCSQNKKWQDGSGILFRKHSLPKNTRNSVQQFQSLGVLSGRIQGQRIVVIDDVITSGSSMRAAFRIIKKHKPASVKGFTLAHKVFLKDIPLMAKF